MLLILSEDGDISSYKVSKWLNYYNVNHVIISEKTKINNLNVILGNDLTSITFNLNNKQYSLSQFNSFWFRRGEFNYEHPKLDIEFINEEVISHLNFELVMLINFIHFNLENKAKTIGSIFKANSNKLLDLQMAVKSGFKIPRTFIVDSKNDLKKLLGTKTTSFITKGIARPIQFTITKDKESYKFKSLTNQLDFDLNKLGVFFFPSLVQEEIIKKYEIRIFFFESFLWAMCIFSQKNPKTSIDFRNYDRENPNRCVPYSLPEDVIKKLNKFIRLTNLSTGSIDLIKTNNNDYVFLEVNPDGQFDFVSHDCNYYIERKIAEYYASE